MSTQHTPGLEAVNPHFYAAPPWYRTRVFKDHAHCYIATIYNDATREGTGIAQVISTTESECDANAHLIAAAPMMLAALKEAPLPTVVGTAFREWYYGERKAATRKAEEGS